MTNHGLLFTFMNGKKGNSAISVQLLKVELRDEVALFGSCCCTCKMMQ